ncbi:hypothetical protein UlMin_041534 [Ulmus minor]
MAEECAESCSVATSSTVPPSSATNNNWWDNLHPGGSGLSSWCNPWSQTVPNPNPNPNSNSSCEEDVSISTSFTNASNHSGLTVESSRRLVEPAASSSEELMAEQHASDNHIWNHVLLNIGSNGDLNTNQDVGENFLDGLSSSKCMSTTGMYEPACDYLKKLESSWEFTNTTPSFNNFDQDHHKPINGFNDHSFVNENERLAKLSNLISTWSIAPPEPELHRQFINPQTCNISLSSSTDHQFPPANLCHLKQSFNDSNLFPTCYVNNLKVENGGGEMERPPAMAAGALLRRPYHLNGINGHQAGINNSSLVSDNGKYYYGMAEPYNSSCNSAKNFADVISFSNRIGKPLIDIHAQPNKNNSIKSPSLSDSKRQGLRTSPPTKSSGRGQGNNNEGKKKRSEDGSNSETSLKKPKQESSTASSAKMLAPKVKLGDKITALQQIVSPFGKTDTASVLYEAIQYIKFLQEQVQLLSNPYMKTNTHKDPWGSLDRKDQKGDVKLDLRSRGLCLVPLSCTPQVYRENTGSDYWTPTYRGCLYR